MQGDGLAIAVVLVSQNNADVTAILCPTDSSMTDVLELEIGRTSVDLLLDKIEGTSHDRLVALRGDLVVGRTTGPPADPGGEWAGRSL